MPKKYGEQSKDDLLEENDYLRAVIAANDIEVRGEQLRLSALEYASKLSAGGTADSLIEKARTIEDYIKGKPADDPDTPVPSPS